MFTVAGLFPVLHCGWGVDFTILKELERLLTLHRFGYHYSYCLDVNGSLRVCLNP